MDAGKVKIIRVYNTNASKQMYCLMAIYERAAFKPIIYTIFLAKPMLAIIW
jgi:hypothetical protein